MLTQFIGVLLVAGETLLKIVPITIALGTVFAVLTHWSACNPAGPWWRKREIMTDITYWFMIPLGARFVRIGLADRDGRIRSEGYDAAVRTIEPAPYRWSQERLDDVAVGRRRDAEWAERLRRIQG